MKRIFSITALLVSLSSAGCSKIYYHNGGPSVANKDDAQYSIWHQGGIFGLVEFSDPVDLKKHCPHGWNTVETENSFLTGLVSGATYSFYTPRKANVVCNP